ncbi:MAG TPA: hypothetical protein VNA24_07700 [Hyalangium sp.]|jgi:hypothetical protein|nr:hypothetical protein [Hyalangium sp.]
MLVRNVLAAISAVALVACSSPDVSPEPQEPGESTIQASLNVPFDLAYGRKVSLPDISLQVTFAELLGDSRCPQDVACVWEGLAAVRLTVTAGGESTSVDLDTRQNSTVVVRGYKIHLEDVSPYPTSTRPQINPTGYSVRLKISTP